MTVSPPLEITAAEALALRNPDEVQGRSALSLTLAELAARDLLRVEPGRLRLTLPCGDSRGRAILPNPSIQMVFRLLWKDRRIGGRGEETPAEAFVLRARAWFGDDFGDYYCRFVREPLVTRGLLERWYDETLGLFPVMGYRRTPAGEAARQTVSVSLDLVQAALHLSATDPDEAAVLLRCAGSAALLRDDLPERLPLLADLPGRSRREEEEGFDLARLAPVDLERITALLSAVPPPGACPARAGEPPLSPF